MLQNFVTGRTESDALVYTDEASAYNGLTREHEAVKYKRSRERLGASQVWLSQNMSQDERGAP